MLADLARTTFYDTFAANNDANDMALHLARTFGVPQQSAELHDAGIATLIVEREGEAIGFAQLREGGIPQGVSGPAPIELWRFYVARGFHGQGIAQALMDRVKDEARMRGAKTLWLGVWEHNARARAFYAKCGFTDAGKHVFLFGTDPQTDLVMTLAL